LEKEPDAPPEKMLIHFACADVVVLAAPQAADTGNSEIRIEVCEVGGSAVRRHVETHIAAVTVTLTKENI